ncbi:MAG: hypothetical protein QM762_04800 [Chryseolinea sp.]
MPIELAIFEPVVVDADRAADLVHHARGELLDLAAADHLAGDDELVPAEAGDGGIGRRAGLQAAGDFGQQLVAGLVAERIVDFLEPVEVHPEQRELLVRDRAWEAVRPDGG